jgi:hypothetical protein
MENIADKRKSDIVVKTAKLQAPADAAQHNLNSLITLKRSLDTTIQEMVDMGIDMPELRKELSIIDERVRKAAIAYGAARRAAERP